MIEFRNVSKVYNNGTEALHNINLKVEKGEFVFIVGSSGAGKSTFLKLITCEERPNEGQVLIDGQDISHIRKGKIPYVRRKMGLVFQDFRLIDHMTVYDNVAFAMRVVGASPKAIKKRVPYILGLVGLQHKAKHYPTEMSGGERQRVGTTVLMVTHEHSLVKHFHKRIIQIHSGEIVADTAAISKEQQAAAQAVATQETVAVDREAIRRAKEARAKADADAQPYATKEFTAPQNNDQANG